MGSGRPELQEVLGKPSETGAKPDDAKGFRSCAASLVSKQLKIRIRSSEGAAAGSGDSDACSWVGSTTGASGPATD